MKITVIELFLPYARNESHVREFLKQNPDKIEVGAVFVADEFPLYGGKIDMVFKSGDDLRFVELKFNKYSSEKAADNARDQMIKYYEGVISFFKLIKFDVNKIYMYLVVGVNNTKEDRRYDYEIKDGKFFYNLDKNLSKVDEDSLLEKYSNMKSDIRKDVITLEENRDDLIKYRDGLQIEVNTLLKNRESILKGYGDKLLYILPDFWSQGVDSHKCFVCGVKSDIAIQAKQGLYGLCNEHFRLLNKYMPYLKSTE